MARPQTHRKSQSTSALSIIASTPGPSRISRTGGSGGLERVDEGTPRGRRESRDDTRGVKREGNSRDTATGARIGYAEDGGIDVVDVEQVRSWMNEVLSFRATHIRRINLLRLMEEALLRCCLGNHHEGVRLTDLLGLNVHTNLLMLLSRHTQTLSSRAIAHTSLPASDEIATALIPELRAIFGLLQGLCLLSAESKKACAEEWAIEMFIDLLLLLRSIPSPTSSAIPTKPVVYHILELLFCILVDSPMNSRMFEKLSGLEAVTRVLKGSGVVKEVRMKCIEFLYFYLLPEHQSHSLSSSSSRSTSGSSTSSDSLYPPSPLDTRSSFTPEIAPRSPTSRTVDLDLNFIPQTPRKKVSPNLGYLTPSSRRVSESSGRSTPRLETVPASPVVGELTPRRGDRRGSGEVGLGLGLPGNSRSVEKASRDDMEGKQGMKRDVTAIHLGALVTSPDSALSRSPRPSKAHTPQSPRSQRSPGSGKMSRSSTQPNLAESNSDQRKSSVSARRMSRSPMVQSSIPDSRQAYKLEGDSRNASGESTATAKAVQEIQAPRIRTPSTLDIPASPVPPVPQPAKIRHSRTSSHLSSFDSGPPPPISLPPKIRHSRTSSQLSVDIDQGVEPKSPRIRHSRTASHLSSLAETPLPKSTTLLSPHPTPSCTDMDRTPSKPKRGFPSELTRGLPPLGQTPTSTSGRPTPLGHTRRVPSISTSRSGHQGRGGGKGSEVKSVQEKKELLGKWIGNVEALVDGVEGAGWWGKGK